jgi:hypothetical protein
VVDSLTKSTSPPGDMPLLAVSLMVLAAHLTGGRISRKRGAT